MLYLFQGDIKDLVVQKGSLVLELVLLFIQFCRNIYGVGIFIIREESNERIYQLFLYCVIRYYDQGNLQKKKNFKILCLVF